MKTIEVGANEHSRNVFNLTNSSDFVHQSAESFKSGAEFAQRWISIEEELPPCSDEDLLLKGIDDRNIEGIVDIGYMHDSTDGKPKISNFLSLGGVLIKITHWRPIEYK